MTEDAIIPTMLERIVARFKPRQVVLFGSRVRGTATESSDVDLLVVFDHVSDKRRMAIDIRRALSDLPVFKDIVVTSPDEIARRGRLVGSILQPALADGRCSMTGPEQQQARVIDASVITDLERNNRSE